MRIAVLGLILGVLPWVSITSAKEGVATGDGATKKPKQERWLDRALEYAAFDNIRLAERGCPFWPTLIEHYALAGNPDEARRVYNRVATSMDEYSRISCMGRRLAGIAVSDSDGTCIPTFLVSVPESYREQVIVYSVSAVLTRPDVREYLAADRLCRSLHELDALSYCRIRIVEGLIASGQRDRALRIIDGVSDKSHKTQRDLATLRAILDEPENILDVRTHVNGTIASTLRNGLEMWIKPELKAVSVEKAEQILGSRLLTKPDPLTLAYGWRQLGWVYLNQKTIDKAKHCANLSRMHMEQIPEGFLRQANQLLLADLLLSLGETEEAKALVNDTCASVIIEHERVLENGQEAEDMFGELGMFNYEYFLTPALIDILT